MSYCLFERKKKNIMSPEEIEEQNREWLKPFEFYVMEYRDKYGKNAMDLAKEGHHVQIIEILEISMLRVIQRKERIAFDEKQVEIVQCSQGCGFSAPRNKIIFHG